MGYKDQYHCYCGLNMSAKAISEADGKSLLTKCLPNCSYVKNKFAVVVNGSNWDEILKRNPWISTEVCLDNFESASAYIFLAIFFSSRAYLTYFKGIILNK